MAIVVIHIVKSRTFHYQDVHITRLQFTLLQKKSKNNNASVLQLAIKKILQMYKEGFQKVAHVLVLLLYIYKQTLIVF